MRQYKQYRMPDNRASYRPKRMLYLDTETKTRTVQGGEHHRMLLAWTCYVRRGSKQAQGVRWHYHTDTYDLCRYIDSCTGKRERLYIFAHNAFFDLQASDFYHYFTRWGWKLDFSYDQGMTYILSIRKDTRNIKVLSTTNYFPYSLKRIGKLMGKEKREISFSGCSREELSDYCRRDVEIIKDAMEYWFNFLDIHDLGNFALTRASQALTAYRHRFKNPHLTVAADTDIKEWERKAYFGGRVECFEIGEISGGPFITLDVNSMYPHVMRSREYPIRFLDYSDNPRTELFSRNLEKYCVIAGVRLKTDEPAYPFLVNGKLIFPVGAFDTYLCTESMRYAWEKGHVEQVHDIAYYEKAHIFDNYVDFFMELKEQYGRSENWLMRDMVKILLNSLYGKFGQKKPVIEDEDDETYDGYWREEIADLITGELITVTKLFNRRITTSGYTSGRWSMPSIAAHVTDYARMYLWHLIRSVGTDRVLYCDTDSIKIRKRDLPYVKWALDSHKLGALKTEDESRKLVIYGPKDYETEKTWKAKGVPKTAVRVSPGVYHYQQFCGQSTHLRAGQARFFMVRNVEKHLTRMYDKGKVLPSGRVIPWFV